MAKEKVVRVAINGFGRIGRLAFRQMFGAKGYKIVAINLERGFYNENNRL